MNVLFVNYGDFTSNSLNHIGAFAARLTLLGHACVVAVPEKPETISAIEKPLFTPATFERLLQTEPLFPDRRGADVVHAWTPRENVRECTLAYLQKHPAAALIIHLEDNEAFLIENYAQLPIATLRGMSDEELARRLSPRLSHPVRFANFLRIAHGATYITDRLREFVPPGKPAHRLLPGVDASIYYSRPPDEKLRSEIGLKPGEKALVFTGSTTFANLNDVRTLLLAVRSINERGTPCKLIRTGINPPTLAEQLKHLADDYVIELGFVEKSRLGALLALADVLVQPGVADDFNDYRLPSKVPEFLCTGRPVVLPRANLAREMEDGRHALLLEHGTPDEIANKCLQIFSHPALAATLSEGALEFARTRFNLEQNVDALLGFYAEVCAQAHPLFADPTTPPSEDVLLASEDLAPRMRAKELTIRNQAQRIESLDAHTRRLQNDLELAGKLDARRTAEASYQHAKLQATRNQVEVLRAQLADAIAGMGHITNELRTLKEQTSTELAHRDAKIKRLTHSFSWQVTSPLRALRRALIDPVIKQNLRQRRPAVDSSFVHVIEQPADLSALAPNGTFRGWLLHSGGTKIVGVRLRAAGKLIDGTYHLPRPDVAAAHTSIPHALHSGFEIDYTLGAGAAFTLEFEALTADGRWRCFAAPHAQVLTAEAEYQKRDYTTWVRRFDTPTVEQQVTLRARLEALTAEQSPLISVLMPTYNTPENWLRKAIDSVRAQFYPHWELCIADDASTTPHVRAVLEEYARRDARIKVTFREANGHISAASNSALSLATGEFVALLDHDDELRPHSLAEVVLAISDRPHLDFIYSDEDKIDERGRRFNPYFKPDWNPDLLLSQNYTCHFSVFRTTRVRAVGGFREGLEGSQDWDLTLRFTEGLDRSRIHHIPRVLYHWRAIPGSTAFTIDEKNDYPFRAAKKALADHFARTGITAELLPVAGRHWRAKRALPAEPPKVSIIIPTRNAENLLRVCLGSIFAKTSYPKFEVIIANNRSDDARTLTYFDELRAAGVRIVDFDAPFNFSAINNFAAKAATGSLLAFLNNDLEVISPDWLEEMAAQACRPEIGCVGAMLYYPDDTVQHAGAVLGLTGPAAKDGVAGHAFKGAKRGSDGQCNRLRLIQNYSAVTAACLVIRREIFEAVGGFNERELAVAFNDIDFCLRVLKAGYRNLWTPFAEFYHHESATRGLEDTPEKIARFQSEVAYMRRMWGSFLDNDPAYNPNLSLQHEDFSLAFPPRVSP